jgi:hypothetical protein
MALKRAHRAIEVFDMSLMAVVTKAMAAFLVLMLVLMPYYTSNPDVTKLAEELQERWGDADDILEKLKQAAARGDQDPAVLMETINKLEEALRVLREENDDLTRLLNEARAQVQRLEELSTEQGNAVAEAQQRTEQYEKTLSSANEPSFSVWITWNGCVQEDLDLYVEPVDAAGAPVRSDKVPPLSLAKVKEDETKAQYHWDVAAMTYQDGRVAMDWPAFTSDVWNQHLADESDRYAVIVKRARTSGPRSDCRVRGFTSASLVTPRPEEAVSSYVTVSSFFQGLLPAGEDMDLLTYIVRPPNKRMVAEDPSEQARTAFRARARRLTQSGYSGAP